MSEQPVSHMAEMITFCRAYHSSHDSPKIFDDHLARELLGEQAYSRRVQQHLPTPEAVAFFEPAFAETNPDPAALLAWAMRTYMPLPLGVSRSRYAEDRLTAAVRHGARQYVILGAGLDSYALRRPRSAPDLQVFEVDRPAMLAHKRSRLAALGRQQPGHLHPVAADLTDPAALRALADQPGYDPGLPTFVSCLGLAYYLPRDAFDSTLITLRDLTPPGTTLAMDYAHYEIFDPTRTSQLIQNTLAFMREQGEPWLTGLDPATLATDLHRLGWHPEEDLSPDQIQQRFFDAVESPYRAWPHVHFATLTSR